MVCGIVTKINHTRPQKIPSFLRADIAQTIISDGTTVKLEISHKEISTQT